MNKQELSNLSDDELLKYAKENKPSPTIDAFFIGFLAGIILFSVVSSSWGLVTILPLFIIYIFLKKPKKYQEIIDELSSRKLK